MHNKEPLEQFRAYYTRSRAAGDHDEAIRLSGAETGLYTLLRMAFYAGWEARGKLPAPPAEVPEGVKNAVRTLRAHFDEQILAETRQTAVVAALGALAEAVPSPSGPLPPLPLPEMANWRRPPVHQPGLAASGYQFGPPPVTNLRDYQTSPEIMGQGKMRPGVRGASCPTCQSADRDVRLGTWSEAFGENIACPDKWHVKWHGTLTGRLMGKSRPDADVTEITDRPAECPACASTVVDEFGLVPSGATGQPVSCTNEWHEFEGNSGGES